MAPTVTLTAPANGATSVAPGSFALTANAADSDGAVSSVEFFSNNVSIGIDSSAPYSMSYGGLAVGSYAIKARATDDGGKFSTSTTATVTVTAATNVAPSITLTGPANGATATAPGSFVIAASASDSDGTIASVKFKSGTTVLATDTTYPYSYTYSGVAAGSYALSAMATDNGGATATSATANVTVTASSNTPPTVTLTAPSNGATVAALSAITLSATASDSNGSIANVKFLANGAVVNTDTVAPYAYSYYTATPGSVAIQAIATDNGGASATSATATITVTAPAAVSETRTYVYDTNERLCKTINPESGATLVDYDAAGNIAWTAEGTTLTSNTCDRASVTAGQKTVRTYDALNRLIAVSTPGGTADVTTTYYEDGAVKTVTAANPGGFNVTTTYTYNKRRLLTAETSTNGATLFPLSYGYTANGHVSSITYPDSQTVSYAPDALGRATTVTAGATTYASGISYYPNGAISGFSYGNAAVHTMTQNARQLPGRSRDVKGSTVILDDSYAFDANGNVLDITDQAQAGLTTRGMAYDGLDRLSSAVGPWGTANYTYDALDNLRSAVQGTRQYRYDYDAITQRLATIKNPAGTTLFTLAYDTRGNTTSKNTQTFVFDAANRMSQVTGQQTYRYDGQGRRVQTTDSDGKTTFWIYSQNGKVLYSSEARRSRNLSYIYLGNTQIATRAVAWGTGVTTLRYQHTDALGSPVAETGATGAVLARTSYAPYGETTPTANAVDGTGYTGHVMDQATGLTYMQARYYDPQIGRFLSTDPAAAGFNLYNYANNNPYRFTDPDGRVPLGGGSVVNRSGSNGGQDFTMAPQSASDMNPSSSAIREMELVQLHPSGAMVLNVQGKVGFTRDGGPGKAEDRSATAALLNKMSADGQFILNGVSKGGIQLTFNIVSVPTKQNVGTTIIWTKGIANVTISFNPRFTLQVGAIRQLPVLPLFHELTHLYDGFKTGQFPKGPWDSSRDNAFVIPKETAYARQLGSVFRHSHDEGNLVLYGDAPKN